MSSTTIPRPAYASASAPRTAGPIVLALGGRGPVAPVVAAARVVAARMHAEPQVVTVVDALPAYYVGSGVEPLPPDLVSGRRAAARSALQAELDAALGSRDRWPLDVFDGPAARTVAQVARDRHARAIIMGIGRHAPMDRLLGEELTLQTLRLADCPVIAVAGSWTDLPQRAVVAVDYSAASVRAAEEALTLLADGGTLTLLHVRPSFDEMMRPAGEVWVGAHRQRLTELLERLRHALSAPAGVTIETMLVAGEPAEEVLAHAARVGAQLVATGSTGRGFFARMVVGSVATRLLRASPVSVLAVPTPTAEETDRIERLLASTRETSEAAQWPAMVAMFSRQNAGRPTRLEVDDPSLGAQTQESGYALVGASYDRRDGRLELMLGDIMTGARRLMHSVGGVQSLAVRTEPDGRDEALQVRHGTGQTILTFRD